MNLIFKEISLSGVESSGNEFVGKASVYGVLDDSNDRVMPQAFTKSIARRSPALLYGHAHGSIPVGKFTKIEDTKEALVVHGALTDGGSMTPELSKAIAFGSLTGLSVGMNIKKATKNEFGGRDILEAELFEVSLTPMPCLAEATLVAKSINAADVGALDGIKGVEAALKDLGLSKNAIKALIHKIKNLEIVDDEEEAAEEDSESESLELINEALQKLIAE